MSCFWPKAPLLIACRFLGALVTVTNVNNNKIPQRKTTLNYIPCMYPTLLITRVLR